MVLPKNITQIGEINGSCKVYVEDYVVSYIKQLNQLAMDKPMAAAVYGIKKEENGVDYLFVYGGAQLDYLSRECRHLSQAQLQEIDRNRKKYFQEYAFLGYCLLSGDMLEGFYIYEQGICRYTPGYARFYEKNDSMLAFMLDNRLTEVSPEVVDETKYAIVRNRQEERKRRNEEETGFFQKTEPESEREEETGSFQYRFAKTAMSAVFCLACVLAVALVVQENGNESVLSADKGAWENLTHMVSGLWEDDAEATQEAQAAIAQGQVDKLVVEDTLNQALLEENKEGTVLSDEDGASAEMEASVESEASVAESGEPVQSTAQTESAAQASEETQTSLESLSESQAVVPDETVGADAPEATTATVINVDAESVATINAETEQVSTLTESVPASTIQLTSYTIMPGDTLIGISTRVYGSEARVSEICQLNNITNPDDIKVGEKILLP